MSDSAYWMTEDQFARLAPLLPTDTRGVARVDDRRVISGIVHVLKSDCRWKDAPALLRAAQDALQPVRPLGGEGCLGGRRRTARGADDRRHPCQGASLGCGWKRGPTSKPSAARAAGGRRRSAAVDECGRPRRLIVRPGHRGDAPVAVELVSGFAPALCLAEPPTTVTRSAHPLSPKARGPSFPTTRPESTIPSIARPTGCATPSNAPSPASRTGAASRPATTSSLKTSAPPSQSPASSATGYES
jgi:transposase